MAIVPPEPGLLLDGKYRLCERIGGGGMAEVYRAENVVAGRFVAVKLLHPELAENAEIGLRFFQEAQAVNRIRHPNIVDVLDAGQSVAGPYLVMELLVGESMGSALARRSRLAPEAAVAIAIPVCDALGAAHAVGVIHRDLKPENVFLAVDEARGQPVVKLLDFGIAKIIEDWTGPAPRTRTGVVYGTPDYLSPEQATGEAPLDGRSDLFSVGVVLFEMLSGTRLFRASSEVATAFRVVHMAVPTLSSAGCVVDPRLEAVVQHLLMKNPDERYACAADVVRDLVALSPDVPARTAVIAQLIDAERLLAEAKRRAPRSGGVNGSRASVPELPSAPSSPQPSNPIPTFERPPAPPPSSSRSAGPPGSGGVQDRAVVRPERPTAIPASVAPNGFAPTRRAPSVGTPGVGQASGAVPVPRTGSGGTRRTPKTGRARVRGTPSKGGKQLPVRDGGASAARPPVVRALPARFEGRFFARGPVLRAVDHALVEAAGPGGRDRVVAALPAAYATDYRNESLNALVQYELEQLDVYMELATALALRDAARWRELGRMSVGGDLGGVLRAALRPAPDLGEALKRGMTAWGRLLSFGVWRVAKDGGKTTLTVSEVDPASLPLRLWLVGVVEETLRRSLKPDLRVTVTRGEMAFVPELVCEIG